MKLFFSFLTSFILVLTAAAGLVSNATARADVPVRSGVSQPAVQSMEQKALAEFASQVTNGVPGMLTGVFIPGKFAYPVVQQPSNNAAFVSSQPDTLTQFKMASNYGTTGLLAHNTLAGAQFSTLRSGDRVVLVYGDGALKYYQVKEVASFQALNPTSPYSDFIDLSDNASRLSATDLFYRVYQGEDQVVLQTCIANEGNPSWGRLFITAEPADTVSLPSPQPTYMQTKIEQLSQILN